MNRYGILSFSLVALILFLTAELAEIHHKPRQQMDVASQLKDVNKLRVAVNFPEVDILSELNDIAKHITQEALEKGQIMPCSQSVIAEKLTSAGYTASPEFIYCRGQVSHEKSLSAAETGWSEQTHYGAYEEKGKDGKYYAVQIFAKLKLPPIGPYLLDPTKF